MAEPDARGLEPLRGPDGVVLPASFAPLAARLAAARITVTSIVTGEVRVSDAYRFLMADDNLAYAQVGEWETHIEDLVAGRRRELLGDRWPAYEQHLAALMSSGASGSTEAQIAAFHHAMATGRTDATIATAPTDLAAAPQVMPEKALTDPGAGTPATERPHGVGVPVAGIAGGGVTQGADGPGLADGGEDVPAQLAPIIERLVAGRITVTEAGAGELGPAETLRFLLGADTPPAAQLQLWAASLGHWVAQRRQEMLGDRFAGYEQHLTALLADGAAEADAPGRAYREVMAAAETQMDSGATDSGVIYQHAAFFVDQDEAVACAEALRAAGCAVQLAGATDIGWHVTAIRWESLAGNDGFRQIAQIVESFGGDYSPPDDVLAEEQREFGIDSDLGWRWPGDTAQERYDRYEAWEQQHPGLDREYPALAAEEEARAAAMAYAEARLGHLASELDRDDHRQLLHGEAERIYLQQQAGRSVHAAGSTDLPALDPYPVNADDLLGELSRTAAGANAIATAAQVLHAQAPPGALAQAGIAQPEPSAPGTAARFRPAGQQDLAPSTPTQRARANIAALRMMAEISSSGGPATAQQQAVLARWGGWGSVPQIFDDDNSQWAGMRAELRELLSDDEYRRARQTTINAHYTDAGFVAEIWSALQALGFDGGNVLEPGSGAGVFLGLAPDGAQMTGVELDPTTASISRLLYPHAYILTESFAATRAPAASFDAAIGNVPFGNVILHDPRHNPHRLTIHNHFLVKALDLVKPGGLMAMLTSAYTMDAANPATRRLLAGQADLIGAIRLPSRAHRAAAGTDALTDILLLRRREPGRAPDSVQWELTNRIEINDHALRINEYFVHRPDLVLGELITGDGLYRDAELAVRGPVGAGLITPLRDALAAVVASAHQRELTFAPQSGVRSTDPVMLVGQGDGRAEGHVQVTAAGGFDVVHSGIVVAHEVPASQAAELRALLELRDITMALLSAEAATMDDTAEIGALRERLNRRYDAYHQRYGPINRFTMRSTGRTDPQTGEAKTARMRPPQGRFREDTYAAAVFALEHFDAETQTARKVELFTQRVIAPRPVRQGADNPADALAIVLDAAGRVDLEHVAALLGVDAGEARTMLGDLVFPDPAAGGQLQPAAAYLSGTVRIKLAQAELAAETDPQYETNVAALRAVIPEDIQPVDIHAALGSVWISAGHVQQFLQEILEDRSVRVTRPGGSIWVVEGGDRGGVQSREVWGTARMPAVKVAAAMLEQRPINVYDIIETADGEKRKLNGEATAAAREKGRELNERFGEWIWEDPARADTLVRSYNNAFNGLVLRNYDDAAPALPGLAASFILRPHQLAAVARIIAEPAVLLGHEVGAGKTLEMIAGAMELRRLGLARKPAVIIPNHMIEQFARDWLQAYPQAKILMVTRDDLASPEKRRHFVARCATGDWDAVIMSRSAFERIPVSAAEQERYLRQELETLEAHLRRLKEAERAAAGEGGKPSNAVKRMEKIRLQTEERLRKKLDSTKDDGITFENTGIDYCFVDEAHGYKNLRTPSNIAGAGIDGSQRATDLDMKLSYLRTKFGGRVATFATATPIANSVTESYVMQKYLRPDLLAAAGIEDFDGWAATFGQVITTIELSPDGTGFRTSSRFAKFRNVPELLKMFWVMADIKTAEDLNLPTPLLVARPDGQRLPETVAVAASAALAGYIPELGVRAEAVRNREVEPEDDNMLKISGDGRKAALDMRMIDPAQDIDEPQKLDVAAGRIHRIWEQHQDAEFPMPDGSMHPRKGAFQIVFLDLGTPSGKGFNAYEQLRRLLTERGMPREAVKFVHEAATDKAKGDMFAACRDGRISVLIGSSEKMGVGTNIQTRAIALHHLDCPWKPAEVQQREGRIIRQGNLNAEVQILRYVTEQSFDGYMWQTVARKQRFISQVMRGRLDVREIDDIGEAALSYAEVMAIAAGNPLLAAKAKAESEVQRLARRQRDRKSLV
ncbi:MAG TPA: helicase [Micromonosporaceae bacterium]|nr:helicase [Micromonosporaceae bacterium]